MQINLRRALSDGLAVDANYRSPSATRPRSTRSRGTAAARASDRRRAARAEDDGHLRAAVRPRPAVRHRREPLARRASVGGWSLNLDRPRAERHHPELRQRARRGHVASTSCRMRSRSASIRATKIVYTLPQDIIDNTIKAFSTSATSATGYGALGPPTRPLPGAGERAGLHPGSARRLRAARRVRRAARSSRGSI